MTNPDYEMHLRPEEDYEMHFDDAGLKPEQTATVTPDYETQTVRPDPGCVFSEVTVEAIPEPTEEIDITENGTVDVARYGVANVAVPVGVFPSGTKVITENVTGEDVTNYAAVDVAVPGPSGTKQISITANGTTTEDVSDYAGAEITVNTLPAKGLVFEDYDEDGYPHSARLVGTWTEIPNGYANGVLGYADTWNRKPVGFGRHIDTLIIPTGVTKIGNNAFTGSNAKHLVIPSTVKIIGENCFSGNDFLQDIELPDGVSLGSSAFKFCVSLGTIVFNGDVDGAIGSQCFRFRDGQPWTQRTLIDFSHATKIPVLTGDTAMQGSNGCVVRIPYALSDEALGEGNGWQSATNWAAMTYAVWELVGQ